MQDIELIHLLIFTIPGFFFLRGYGYTTKSDLFYFMYSVFWGILMMVAVYNKFLSLDQISLLIGNPYAGVLVFSLLAWIIGWCFRFGLRMMPRPPYEF